MDIKVFGYGTAASAGGGARVCALAAVPLLAKHEQKSPSAEQPFPECCGGEEQGNATHEDLCFSVLDKYVFIGPLRLLLRLI